MLNREYTTELLTGKDSTKRKSRMPARIDFLQSVSGLFLALFIMFHLLFESSILLGKEAMYRLTKLFEGEPFIEGGEPLIISALAVIIFTLFVVHAGVALRKFPSSYHEYRRYIEHKALLKHNDTNLWYVQITTGFIMFFLGSIHLYMIMTQPENIGPYASSDRIYSDLMWPMYLVLLISVVLHGGIGMYRLIIKWGWFDGTDPRTNRKRSRVIIKVLVGAYLLLGLASLGTYMKIGYEHQGEYGKRYVEQQK
ncbi:fumarate reductase cytochrome b subunit [Sulfurovum sp. NBC37-1]|uniref:fumarate reductase cytochrome b subunit n=1 Tax=Sulfurovum sp. (strain NBC37-1) TaxID=387093 RepID=UPI0001587852|nr:fumarate reductase cytochrome b subunit [Sulfurovum sp. NBC37-1]BAF71372.1 fumarate reductase, cytochrome b subunit [Sulfurovum sp. NBC37-1]